MKAIADTSLPTTFNPWRDTCELHDRADAVARRRDNLERILVAAIDARVDTMWIARDLGYRGGRRTGVPLTDEVHLDSAGEMLGGIELARATEGPIVAERTAAIIWRVLGRIGQPVMLWNVFPFHPHDAGSQLSNRCHTRAERLVTWPLLQALVEMLRPRQIVAIGRDAQIALAELGVPTAGVRHPSYGGQREFMDGVYSLYGIVGQADEPGLTFVDGYAGAASCAVA